MTYADDYDLRDKDLAKINDVADAIDGLLVATDSTAVTSVQSTSSDSYSTITGATVSITVESGQIVLVFASLCASSGTAARGGYFRLYNSTESTALTQDVLQYFTLGSTNAIEHELSLCGVDTSPAAGSNTYEVQFKRSSSATTIYADEIKITVMTFRNTSA